MHIEVHLTCYRCGEPFDIQEEYIEERTDKLIITAEPHECDETEYDDNGEPVQAPSIWLVRAPSISVYVTPDNLGTVVHNHFLAGGGPLELFELDNILFRDEVPAPRQTVIIQNLMGFAEWRESIPKKLEK